MNQPTPATDPMPPWPGIVLDVERARDQADDDTGSYYAIAKRSGTLVTRGGRPLTATLTEWSDLSDALPTTAYIPVGAHPLFGSLPLHDTGKVPDLVGRLVNAVGFLEAGATMLVSRVQHFDKAMAAHLPDSTAAAAQQREARAEAEARPHDAQPTERCGRCKGPLAPEPVSMKPVGVGYCDACVDRCHEATEYDHECAVCRSPSTRSVEEQRADRSAEIIEAERSEQVHGG